VSAEVVASVPPLPRADSPRISLASRDALEASLREAVALGSRRIGPEHLLLGVLRRPTGTVRRVLARLEVEPERLAALVRVEIAAQRRCA
jgi:ATP-dependent Clp protease ATP-binding subunit ClpA